MLRDYNAERLERDSRILAAAVAVAGERGYASFSRLDVAQRAEVSEATVSNFGVGSPLDRLREAVVREAIRLEILPILAQAIVANAPAATDIPEQLKARALAGMLV
jgi:AcrR family transcriptional regulator